LAAPSQKNIVNKSGPVSFWISGSLLFALIAAVPIIVNTGFLNTRSGGDSPFLLFRLHQLYTALLSGAFPVRWMPDAAYGLGYPFFNYYAALPFYFAAVFKLLGFSYVVSLKLTQIAGFLAAAAGMYAWINRITLRREAAALASIAYTFAPFHMVNVYVRGDSLSEFWAMAWYPLILLAIYDAADKPTLRRIALVGLSFGALVMTHNVSAMIFSPFVASYAVGCVLTQRLSRRKMLVKKGQRILWLAVGGVLGLALAAWVWLPALAETQYAQLEVQTSGFLYYGEHFRTVDLVQRGLVFDYTLGRQNITPFSMGLVQVILLVIGLILLIRSSVTSARWWDGSFLLGGLLASTFMITPLSRFIWGAVPLLPFAQFPWRFLSVQSLFVAAITGWIAPRFVRPPLRQKDERLNADLFSKQWQAYTVAALGIIAATASLAGLKPNFIRITDADVTPERLQWYESFSGNIGTTIRNEYLPTWTRPRPHTSDILLGRAPRAKFLEGNGEAERLDAKAHRQSWQVTIDSNEAVVAFPLLYFPGWYAQLDGERTDVGPVEGIGYTQMELPAGEHNIELRLGRTPVRLAAEIVSLVALVLIFVSAKPSLTGLNRMDKRWLALPALFALIIVIVNLIPEPEVHETPLTADFSQEAYFHQNDTDIQYANQAVLQGATVQVENSSIIYEMEWQATSDEDLFAHLSLTSPFQQWEQGGPEIELDDYSISQQSIDRDVELTNPTPGLYFPQVEVYLSDDAVSVQPLTQNGLTRADLALSPVIVSPQFVQPDSLLRPGSTDFGWVELDGIEVQTTYEQLDVTLWWKTLSEAEKNYAIAFRLRDEAGNTWAELDTQAGAAGLYPTGLWHTGETIPDHYRLALQPGTPPGMYALDVTLYDVVSLEPIGTGRIENVRSDSVSRASCQVSASRQMYDEMRIRSVEVPLEGKRFSVEWTACGIPQQDYRVAWTFNGTETYRYETELSAGDEPTQWEAESGFGSLIRGIYHFDELSPGDYAVSLQLLDENGNTVGTSYEVEDISIVGIQREFQLPEVTNVLEADFAGLIKLYGYNLEQSTEALVIDLVWKALDDIDTDYMVFVHLIDPGTETILSQIDTMPKGFTYPTSAWIMDEVVQDSLSLDLTNVPAGEYQLVVGWYLPGDFTRLEALYQDGSADANRRILLQVITVGE